MNSMTQSQLVEPKLTERDLMEFLYRGVEPRSVATDYDPTQYNKLCEIFEFEHTPIKTRKAFEGTWEEYADLATSDAGWNMPQKYKDMDVEEYLHRLCTTDTEHQRVSIELEMFKQRRLLPLLKFLKYMVDTMRNNSIVWGVGRGSSVSSYVLFLLGVHKIDSLKYDLDIKEFLK